MNLILCLCCGAVSAKSTFFPPDKENPFYYYCITCQECKAHYCIIVDLYKNLSLGDKANRDFKEFYDSKYEPDKKLKPREKLPIIGGNYPFR